MKFLPFIFCLACTVILSVVEGSPAQTTVCSGDSVVLVLKGYKQGEITWKQSYDKTDWDPATGTQYNDSLLVTATTTLYYYAFVIDGTCDNFYSDTTLVIVNPTPPVAKPATGITPTSFIANWSTVPGATDYFLDVSIDPTFTTFLPGKKNIHAGYINADTTYPIDGLTCNNTYYYRVRDTSDVCLTTSANSNTITVTTYTCPDYCTYKSTCNGNLTDSRDGKTYNTVQIGTQCWMAQNLNVGTAIPGVVQQTDNTILEKYCYDYGGTTLDSIKCATYGGLYLWDEMMAYGPSVPDGKGPKGICPTGWHIPTDEEWKCLEMTLGMTEAEVDGNRDNTTAGNKLKTKGNGAPPLWASPSAGTDTSHFSALPSGTYDGSFNGQGTYAYLWTATERNATSAWIRYLTHDVAQVYRDSGGKLDYGCSVRCVKDF